MRRENKHIVFDGRNEQLPNTAFLLDSLRVPKGKPKEQLWEAIFEEIRIEKQLAVVPFERSFLRVAAAVILFIGVGASTWFYGLGNVEIVTPKGSQLAIYLPDSSHVMVNADSKVRYNQNRWIFERKVKLQGEAMFQVRKGSKFSVYTTTATTTVMGTVFNVYSRKGITTVSCIEGKVKVVAAESKKEVLLTKGTETKTMGYAMEKPMQTEYIKENIAWTNGDFYFNNSPINSVIEELERQFDVDVFFDGDTNRFYTGYFNKKNLNDALNLVCIPMNLNWTISNNVIIIKGKQ